MYAVIETCGKQYRVTEGDVLFLERLNSEPGDSVKFDKILACSNEIDTEFGKPYLNDVSVEGKVLGHGKDKKIVVFKYKAKKGYRKKQGHRQPYSKIRIERIISGKFGVAEYVEAEEAAVEPESAAAVKADAGKKAAAKAEAVEVEVAAVDADADDVETVEAEVVGVVIEDAEAVVVDAVVEDVDADADDDADVDADADDDDADADDDADDADDDADDAVADDEADEDDDK